MPFNEANQYTSVQNVTITVSDCPGMPIKAMMPKPTNAPRRTPSENRSRLRAAGV